MRSLRQVWDSWFIKSLTVTDGWIWKETKICVATRDDSNVHIFKIPWLIETEHRVEQHISYIASSHSRRLYRLIFYIISHTWLGNCVRMSLRHLSRWNRNKSVRNALKPCWNVFCLFELIAVFSLLLLLHFFITCPNQSYRFIDNVKNSYFTWIHGNIFIFRTEVDIMWFFRHLNLTIVQMALSQPRNGSTMKK